MEQDLKNKEEVTGRQEGKGRHQKGRNSHSRGREGNWGQTKWKREGEKGGAAKGGMRRRGGEKKGSHGKEASKEKLVEPVCSEETEKRGKEKSDERMIMNEYGTVPQIVPAAFLNLEEVHAIFKHCVSV